MCPEQSVKGVRARGEGGFGKSKLDAISVPTKC